MALDVNRPGHVTGPSADRLLRGVRRGIAQWCRRHQAWGHRLTVSCRLTLAVAVLATVATTGMNYRTDRTDPARPGGSASARFEAPTSPTRSVASQGAGQDSTGTALVNSRAPAPSTRVASTISQVPAAGLAVPWPHIGVPTLPDMAVRVAWGAGAQAPDSPTATSPETGPPQPGVSLSYLLLVAVTVLATAAALHRRRGRHAGSDAETETDAEPDAETDDVSSDEGRSAWTGADLVKDSVGVATGARDPDPAAAELLTGSGERPGRLPAGTPDAGTDDGTLREELVRQEPPGAMVRRMPTDGTDLGATADADAPSSADQASGSTPPTLQPSRGVPPSPAPATETAASADRVVTDGVPVEATVIIRHRTRTGRVR